MHALRQKYVCHLNQLYFQICANWEGFYDPESGISEYLFGVGSAVGKTDIIKLKHISYKEHFACLKVSDDKSLIHGSTYYTTVYAINGGIVKRNTSAVSNGGMMFLSDYSKYLE